MAAPTNHWKLGLFVVVGVVLGLTTIAVLGARAVREEVSPYVTYFNESVQGVDVGSPIKFRGVIIGTVAKIGIAPDRRHVEVTSDLKIEELTRLGLNTAETRGGSKKLVIAPDLRVQLATAGLTGLKFLQLDFFDVTVHPPPKLPFDVPGNYIPAAASTLKNAEDALVKMLIRLPELTEQLSEILLKVDGMLGQLREDRVPEQIAGAIERTNQILIEAQHKIAQIDAGKLGRDAEKTLEGLNRSVARVNALLERIDGDKGLLSSVIRASDAFGDTVRSADGIGGQLEDALSAVQDAARSIHKLANALEKDPDMLLKGRSRAPEKNR